MTLPGIDRASSVSGVELASAQANTAKAQATTKTNASNSGTSGGLSGTTTGTTFLSLLVKELQNQDPTAPMDSTAMVGQMISLNQLDQLISINQTLTTSTSSNPKAVAAQQESAGSSSVLGTRATPLSNTYAPTSAAAANLAANNPGSILDFSNVNIPQGGK